mmetsp:Transcript_20308/g.38213  ORF Transcript_20308/g.38213 Transcript_20308/m.38213 type:complete len:90 (+) Transcript_20308:908-1177(+)
MPVSIPGSAEESTFTQRLAGLLAKPMLLRWDNAVEVRPCTVTAPLRAISRDSKDTEAMMAMARLPRTRREIWLALAALRSTGRGRGPIP